MEKYIIEQLKERMPHLEISPTDWELLAYHAAYVLEPRFEIKQIEKEIDDLQRQIKIAKRRKETDAVETIEKEILQLKLDIEKIIAMAKAR